MVFLRKLKESRRGGKFGGSESPLSLSLSMREEMCDFPEEIEGF